MDIVDPNIGRRHRLKNGDQFYLVATLNGKNCYMTGNFSRNADDKVCAEYEIGDQKRLRWRDADGNWQPHHFVPTPDLIWHEEIEWVI